MEVRITDIGEITKPISSPIRNAYIDFSKMTSSLVAGVTNVERNGKRVIGLWLQLQWRRRPGQPDSRTLCATHLEARPAGRAGRDRRRTLDPDRVWSAMMTNEKPSGHGDGSVAVGTMEQWPY